MKLEHVALLVAGSRRRWRAGTRSTSGCGSSAAGDAPGHARFLADDAGASVLEIYAGTLPVPDYARHGPLAAARRVRDRRRGARRARG